MSIKQQQQWTGYIVERTSKMGAKPTIEKLMIIPALRRHPICCAGNFFHSELSGRDLRSRMTIQFGGMKDLHVASLTQATTVSWVLSPEDGAVGFRSFLCET